MARRTGISGRTQGVNDKRIPPKRKSANAL